MSFFLDSVFASISLILTNTLFLHELLMNLNINMSHLVSDTYLMKNTNYISIYDYIQWKYGFALKYYFKMFWILQSDFYIPFLLVDAYTSVFPYFLVVCIIFHFNFLCKTFFCVHHFSRRLVWLLESVCQDAEEACKIFSGSKSNGTSGDITSK